jgi:hypothetical protein
LEGSYRKRWWLLVCLSQSHCITAQR